jgi:ribosome-associated translation inhibitor RaiA
MKFPLTVTFHKTRRSIRVEEIVQEQAERLDKFHHRIQHCEVVIDQPHHNHNKGNEFHIRILLTVPGNQIAANSSSSRNSDHESVDNAVKDAFEAARRQLREVRVNPGSVESGAIHGKRPRR